MAFCFARMHISASKLRDRYGALCIMLPLLEISIELSLVSHYYNLLFSGRFTVSRRGVGQFGYKE